MINSNDGGANVSTNGGKSWSTQQNHLLLNFIESLLMSKCLTMSMGGQQDNSAIGIKSRTNKQGIDWKDWYSVSGCESAFLAFDPKNPEHIYGGLLSGNY